MMRMSMQEEFVVWAMQLQDDVLDYLTDQLKLLVEEHCLDEDEAVELLRVMPLKKELKMLLLEAPKGAISV